MTTRILEASQLGTLDAPDVHLPQGAEDLWTLSPGDGTSSDVGSAKKWHLFVVNDDSVVNAMAAFGACFYAHNIT